MVDWCGQISVLEIWPVIISNKYFQLNFAVYRMICPCFVSVKNDGLPCDDGAGGGGGSLSDLEDKLGPLPASDLEPRR